MTEIGFGTWSWGNKLLWGYKSNRDDKLLKETFIKAIECGLILIDTADSYGIGKDTGRSEVLIGNFIQDIDYKKRKKIIIATKLAPYPWRLGRNGFKKAFFASKYRLKGNLNRIQLHWSTSNYAPWQEAGLIDGLGDLYEDGEISEIGISNTGPLRLKWMHKRLLERGIKIKSLQIQMSLLSPEPQKNNEIKNVCKELDIDLIAYSPLALGILAIPPEKEVSPETYLRKSIFKRILPSSKIIRKALKDIGKDHNASQSEVALNWCRAHGAIPIPGIRTPKQAAEASSALQWKLNNEEKKYLDNLSNNCQARMPRNPFTSK